MRASRAVPVVNAAVAGCLVAAMAAIALVTSPPAPPGISEFAPNASRPITRAPSQQVAREGQVPGASASPVPSAGNSRSATKAVPKPTDAKGVPSALSCVQWLNGAVTQTFDPQSPPCIASWDVDKGNGGATTSGVTASAVKVAVCPSNTVEPDGTDKVWRAYADFFNSRYQLYGRKIALDFQSCRAAMSDRKSPNAQHANAQAVLAAHPFATTTYSEARSAEVYPLDVARGHVVYASGTNQGYTTSREADRYAPYLWSYFPEFDRRNAETGRFLCTSLGRRPARLSGLDSGDGSFPARSYAVLLPKYTDRPSPNAQPVLDTLASCGIRPKLVVYDGTRIESGALVAGQDYQAELTQIMVQLRNEDVTTLVMQAGTEHWVQLFTAADGAAYQPEWVRSGACYAPDSTARELWPARHLSHMVGLWGCPKDLGTNQAPWKLALGGVSYNPSYLYSPTFVYHSMGLIAAGIQLAGPRLTPQSFAAGLQDAHFPNPGAGQAPAWQAGAGFQPDRFSLVRDFALVRWSTSARSKQDNQPGTWCYVQRGRRFSSETGWPRTDDDLAGGPTPCH